MKIRKKPIIVEAWEIDLTEMIYNGSMPTWVYRAWKEDKKIGVSSDGGGMVLRISTPEGVMSAQDRDVLVKGVKGEFYSIKKSIFEETYDVVDDESFDEIAEAAAKFTESDRIRITDMQDLPDGSVMCAVNMDYDTMVQFARIGLMKAIEDACDRAEEELAPNVP